MSEKVNTIGKEYTLWSLSKFVFAPVLTKLVGALVNTLDDSLFLSRYCGENALASFSILMPWFMIVDAIAMLIGAVSIHCSIKMGEKKSEQANSDFTSMCIVAVGIGLFLTLILTLFRKQILIFLGATELLLPYSMEFTNISRIYIPLILLENIFNRFYVIAGKPKNAVINSVVVTISNFFFDYLFMAKLQVGVVGAAYSNLIGELITCTYGFIFFLNHNEEIHFSKPNLDILPLVKDVFRLGRPMMVTSLSLSINSFISNYVILSIAKEDCVAAYTIVGNVQFMFMNVYFGLLGSTGPLVSYAYGEKNRQKLGRILKQVFVLIGILSLLVIGFYFFGKDLLLSLYLPHTTSESVYQMVDYGFKISPYVYIFLGYNIMAQDEAASLNNNKLSSILSILENLVFSNLSILVLPRIFGIDGVWFAFLVCEALTFIFTLIAIIKNADVYGYGRKNISTFDLN